MNRGPQRPRRISHVRVDLKQTSHPSLSLAIDSEVVQALADKVHRLRQLALFACQGSLAVVRLSQETRAQTRQHMVRRVRLAKTFREEINPDGRRLMPALFALGLRRR